MNTPTNTQDQNARENNARAPTLTEILAQPPCNWQNLIIGTSICAMQDLAREASAAAVRCAMIDAYLGGRGVTCGSDNGESYAQRAAERASKRTRKALGFSYP